jgi:peptidoglycan-associated lipoprotein
MKNSITVSALLFALTGCASQDNATQAERTSANSSGSEATAEANRSAPMQCDNAPVFFETGSADISAEAQARLNVVADCLRNDPSRQVIVTGRADAPGTEASNQELGARRAAAVTAYLREHGVSNPNVIVRSNGEAGSTGTNPVDRNATVQTAPR